MKTEMTLKVDLDEIINELPVDLSWAEEEHYSKIVDTTVSATALIYVDPQDFYCYDIDINDITIELCQSVRRKFDGVIFDSEKWMDACRIVVRNWDESGDITTELQEDEQVADEYRAESLADDRRDR